MIVDGAVVLRSGAGSLVKFVLRGSVNRGVKGVHVHVVSRRRVYVSRGCAQSACIREDFVAVEAHYGRGTPEPYISKGRRRDMSRSSYSSEVYVQVAKTCVKTRW